MPSKDREEPDTQAALSNSGTYATLAGAPATLNTKPLFKLMVERKASDLFFTSNSPIKVKIEGQIMTELKGLMTNVKADAILTVKGSLTMIG